MIITLRVLACCAPIMSGCSLLSPSPSSVFSGESFSYSIEVQKGSIFTVSSSFRRTIRSYLATDHLRIHFACPGHTLVHSSLQGYRTHVTASQHFWTTLLYSPVKSPTPTPPSTPEHSYCSPIRQAVNKAAHIAFHPLRQCSDDLIINTSIEPHFAQCLLSQVSSSARKRAVPHPRPKQRESSSRTGRLQYHRRSHNGKTHGYASMSIRRRCRNSCKVVHMRSSQEASTQHMTGLRC